MTKSVVSHLILKDLRLNRGIISLCVLVGLAALIIAQFGGETVRILGSVWFFVSLCILASVLPASAILNERKKQTLGFIMSLPVSPVQYSVSKAFSTLAMFLIPWLSLLICAVVVIEIRPAMPHGVIPMFLIVAMLPLIGFCLIAGACMLGESEAWLVGASVACNSSYWFVWYLLAGTASLTADWTRPVAVWSPAVLIALSGEAACIVIILAATFLFQSRKRSFI